MAPGQRQKLGEKPRFFRRGEAGARSASRLSSFWTPPMAAYCVADAKELHAQATVLETDFADRVAAEPELLARHLTEAGHFEKAVPWWQRAGERATERSANAEAIGSWGRNDDGRVFALPRRADRVHAGGGLGEGPGREPGREYP